jgi:hypothetical protein
MNAHDQLLAAAAGRADEIAALPPEQRDDRYTAMKIEHLTKARAMGLPDDAAQELVDQMDRTIRRLVAESEAGAR